MAECTYDFTGPDGKPVRIQGKAEFKAYLANGGLEHFGIRSPGGDAKFLRSSQAMPDTIKVNGVDRPTTNSTGKPIHPTEEGVRKFWEWFGGSKAVDKDGKPLVVYHGTTENFDSFSPPLAGAVGDKFASASFFTSSPTIPIRRLFIAMVIGNVDTLFLPSRPEHAHISSTIVRELIANKADVSAFVPKAVVLP